MHIPRSHSAGGGVGIIFKNSILLNTSLTDQYQSFELMDFHQRMVHCVRILLVYRPPSMSTSLFLEEFSKLLEHITADLRHKRLLIVSDFNIHVDNSSDATARRVTLKAGMTERRNHGITERRKITPNPKRWNRGMAERRKITPNPKRRKRGTAE